MVVENIHVFQSHAFQALVEAGDEVLARTPFSIRAIPHQITCFGGDDQFIAMRAQILFDDLAEGLFGRTGRGAVIVCQIKMCDAYVKCAQNHVSAVDEGVHAAKIVPQAQRDGRQFQSTAA